MHWDLGRACVLSLALSLAACASGGDGSSDAPRFTSVAPRAATVGTEYVYPVVVTGDPPPVLSLSGAPTWLSLDAAIVSGTPGPEHVGPVSFTVSATNGVRPDATQLVQLGVVQAGDDDQDGLDNADELALGTDPADPDSDHDGKPDGVEVGPRPSPPLDSDGDGLMDALEGLHADNDNDGIPDENDASSGWQMVYGRFWPFAVRNDGSEATRLEVRIVGGQGVAQVWAGASDASESPLRLPPLDDLMVDGAPVPKDGIELFDDGTHGDRVGADGIWSRGGITALTPALTGGKVGLRELDEVRVRDDTGTRSRAVWQGYQEQRSVFVSGSFDLGVVSPGALVTPQPFGDGHQATSNLVNLVAPRVMPTLVAMLNDDGPNVATAAREVMGALGYEVDFLYLFPEYYAVSGAGGATFNVRNDAAGLGIDVGASAGDFGSTRLQSVFAMNFSDNGPLLHETAHRYGVFLDPSLGFSGTHWGTSGADGQLGGFDPASLVDHGDGTYTVDRFGRFANGGDTKRYGPWELYLMGLLDPAELPPLPVLRGAESLGISGGRETLRAAALDSITLADLVAIHGVRKPAFGEAKTAFRAAFVAVSARPLTATEMSFYESWAARFGADKGDGDLLSFREATGARATMETAVP
ncbi:MAG: hypothetical protein R3F39_25990 [Myxococcota bacterium]